MNLILKNIMITKKLSFYFFVRAQKIIFDKIKCSKKNILLRLEVNTYIIRIFEESK